MSRIVKFPVLFAMFAVFTFNYADAQYRKVKNTAFKKGEKLTYVIYFDSFLTGKIKAAYGTFEILPESETIGGRSCMHVVVSGATFKKWDWAIYVQDRFDSYIDEEAMMPWLFLRRAKEGNYEANQDIFFNHAKNIAKYKNNKDGKEINYYIPTYTQDMISAGYYARTMDLTNLAPGVNYTIPFVFEDSLFSTTLVYMGKKKVKIGLGKYRCMVFKPKVLVGSVFGESYPITMYITDDENRVPIYAKASILIGTVKFELVDYKNLRNPITSKYN